LFSSCVMYWEYILFKDATLFFSRSTPNLATVIPAMDHIDAHLTTVSQNSKYSPAIRASLALGKAHLNKYYDLTDHSEVYRIAMILHPRHKLQYFHNANWDDVWITTATAIVCDEFLRAYADLPIADVVFYPADMPTKAKCRNIFDDLPSLSAPVASTLNDELQQYLECPVEDVKNASVWWVKNRAVYPRLSRMALNYLSIPATSVDVERVFSKGRLILSHVRNGLSVQSTRALVCLGAWSRMGFIKDKDVMDAARLPDVEGCEAELDSGWDDVSE